MRKTHLYFCILALLSLNTKAQINLDSIFHSNIYNETAVQGMRFLKDGKSFCRIVINPTTKYSDIIAYDLLSNKAIDTIFKGIWLKPSISESILRFNNFQFSKDETKILLATGQEKIYRRSRKANYYIWDRTTNKLSEVLSKEGKQKNATFSPDGSKVAFARANNLFIKNLQTNATTQITTDGKWNNIINGTTDWVYEEEFGFVKAFFWNANSKQIAYYKFDESKVKEFNMAIYNGDAYPKEYKFKYPKVGEANAIISIHNYNLATTKTTHINIGDNKDQYIPRIKWTNDPNLLVIQRMNRHQNHLEFLLTDVIKNKTKIIYDETNKWYINITDNLTFLKNNKEFIITSEKDGYNHIYLYDMNGKPVRQLTKGNWDVSAYYGIDEANGKLYYQSSEISPLDRHIYVINLDGSNKIKLSNKSGREHASFTPTFDYYISTWSDATTPTVTNIKDNAAKTVRMIEDNTELSNRFKKEHIAQKEFFNFKTSEGISLNAFMIKPVNFDKNKKYPVLMYVYGGPGHQTVTNSWSSSGREMWFRYLVAQGYIIVSVDNRGTGARGETFKKQTYMNMGYYETIDQIESAKYLGNLPYVDKNRIGIFGWSYGGFMAAKCILQGAEIFKAAISVAPVTNWKYYDSIYTERYMRTYKENKEKYESTSPITYADRLKGKYLLVHGSADDNVHYQNSMELVKALVKAGKQFDLMIYPNRAHGMGGGGATPHLYHKMSDFILNNL